MKALYIVSAAALALVSTPALAQDAVGSVGLTYGSSEVEFGGFEAEGDTYVLDASVARPAFGDWTVTLAGNLGRADVEGGDDDTIWGGQAHLSQVFGGDMRAGGFVSVNNVGGQEFAYSAGAEVQKYLANMTLSGVLAYTTGEGSDVKGWTVGGDAAYYPMSNLRLNAGVSYSSIDAFGVDLDATSYGVGAEYMFGNTPYSVTAGYSHSDLEQVDADTVTVGLRMSFGGGLQARDRAGANLAGSPAVQAIGLF